MKTCPALLLALLASVSAAPAALINGQATIDYNQTAWNALASGSGLPAPALVLSEVFNEAAAAIRTDTQINTDDLPGSPSYTGQIYAMNGSSVSNLSGRNNQPTTFSHTPGALPAHTGVIGLAGIARFGTLIGPVSIGEFTLQYDASRNSPGQSGWYLNNNFGFPLAAFDLMNVSLTDTASTFSISGDLGVSPELAVGLLTTPGDALDDVGNFTFTATVVPEASTGMLGLSALVFFALRRRK